MTGVHVCNGLLPVWHTLAPLLCLTQVPAYKMHAVDTRHASQLSSSMLSHLPAVVQHMLLLQLQS